MNGPDGGIWWDAAFMEVMADIITVRVYLEEGREERALSVAARTEEKYGDVYDDLVGDGP